jgi:hypothetical protein
MKNGREQEQLTPSTPIKQADTKTTPIHSSYSSVQDMEAQSVVNGENYLQIISELEEKQKHDPNYKPNAIELAALEWKRVKELFDSIEPKK